MLTAFDALTESLKSVRTNRILYLPGDNDVFVDGGPEHATRHGEGTYLGRDAVVAEVGALVTPEKGCYALLECHDSPFPDRPQINHYPAILRQWSYYRLASASRSAQLTTRQRSCEVTARWRNVYLPGVGNHHSRRLGFASASGGPGGGVQPEPYSTALSCAGHHARPRLETQRAPKMAPGARPYVPCRGAYAATIRNGWQTFGYNGLLSPAWSAAPTSRRRGSAGPSGRDSWKLCPVRQDRLHLWLGMLEESLPGCVL